MTWTYSLTWIEFLLIGLAIFLYLFFLVRYLILRKKTQIQWGSLIFKLILRASYVALFVIAILGPSFGEKKKEIKVIAKDIFIAIDISESMNAIDIQPSRLERVKFELKNKIEKLQGNRIGIIIFSSEAFIQCPLTYDQSAIQLFLGTINTQLVSSRGTDFSKPLQLALEKLTNDESTTRINNHAKIILLISDGEDFGTETQEVIKKIKNKDIQLFILGVGTLQGSKIPSLTGGFVKNESKQEVITILKRESMQEIASQAKGIYYEINQERNEITRLFKTLQELKGELKATQQSDISSNNYFYFLLVALFLFTFDILFKMKAIKL